VTEAVIHLQAATLALAMDATKCIAAEAERPAQRREMRVPRASGGL